MESYLSKVIETLKKSDCIPFEMFPLDDNRILIKVPASEHFEDLFMELQSKIIACLDENLPQREHNLFFEVKNSGEAGSFMVYK